MPTTNVLLSQYLLPDHVVVPLRADTQAGAVAELVGRLVKHGAVRDAAALDEDLLVTRNRDVVSIGNDVVLPHVRSEGVDRLVIALGIAAEPLKTNAQGTAAPRIVALVIAPPEAATLYLQSVAALARFFSSATVRARMHDARTAADVLAMPELGALRIEPQLTVRDLMMHDATTVAPGTSARSAVNLMIDRRQRALPVVSDTGEVVGIVTEWDIMRALLPHIPRVVEGDDEPDDPAVREIMTRSVLCVPEELGLEEAVNLMINKKVEQCPVVRDSTFVGMLNRSDIIRKLFAR